MDLPVPQQMFDHCLNYLKGWFTPHCLDFDMLPSPSIDNTCLPYGGRVLHLDSTGKYRLGHKGIAVPIFAHQGFLDYDVANPGGVATSPHGWGATSPTGKQSGLVALGPFELVTTEFYQTDGVTYAPNDLLKAPTEDQVTGADKSTAGKLYKTKAWPGGNGSAFTIGTDATCAQVSRGVMPRDYNHRVNSLAFWTHFVIAPTN